MKRGRRAPILGAFVAVELLAAIAVQTWSTDCRADAEADTRSAESDIRFVARTLPSIEGVVARTVGERPSAERRIAAAEMLYRTKDYERAVVAFSEILEEFPNTASYPDALWLRAETFYASEQYLSARRDYQTLIDRAGEGRFESYVARALARLVDVSLRLNDPPESLVKVFDRLGQLPPAQVDAAVDYARGKALFRQKRWDEAKVAFSAIPAASPYTYQGRYFQGLVEVRKAREAVPAKPADGSAPAPANFKAAIDAFQQVVELSPDTPEHKHVIDLAWLAIGRLFYEAEQYNRALEAYQNVDRTSPEFDTMLYEVGWVYVRLGDVEKAERSLEVLAISDPGSQFIADGTLLRADLLLRAGSFDAALQLYEGIRVQYDPMRARVDAFLDSASQDVSIYYQKLAQQQLDVLEPAEVLPPIAIRWAREADDGPLAFALIDDANQCRALMRESARLVEKLNVIVHAANRVEAFPELAAGVQATLELANRLAHSRFAMAHALDKEEPSELTGEIAAIRHERRQLMETVSKLPMVDADFSERAESGNSQWNHVSQELTRRSLEVDQLQASLNALRQILRSEPQSGITRDPASVREFSLRLDETEHEFKRYRDASEMLRHEVEIGRAQIGIGDSRFQNDSTARNRFRELIEREVQLAAAGGAGGDGQRIAARLLPVVEEARRYDDQVDSAMRALEVQVAKRSDELQKKVDSERQNLATYKGSLEGLDNQAKDVIGGVAKRNFTVVRDRLRNVVLRADVGITEQAWEVREEEQGRVHDLQSERARQEQLLDEELKEVRDDGVESSAPSGASP